MTEKQLDKAVEFASSSNIQTIYLIECTVPSCNNYCKCDPEDILDAAFEFMRLGWKNTSKNTFCPKHAKQKHIK